MFVASTKQKNLHFYDVESILLGTTSSHTIAPSVALKELLLVVELIERARILSKKYEHIRLPNLNLFILLILDPVSFPLIVSSKELHQSNIVGVIQETT